MWLGLNPQIGRPLSRIVVPLVYFFIFMTQTLCPGLEQEELFGNLLFYQLKVIQIIKTISQL
jgi:hypothetical protein